MLALQMSVRVVIGAVHANMLCLCRLSAIPATIAAPCSRLCCSSTPVSSNHLLARVDCLSSLHAGQANPEAHELHRHRLWRQVSDAGGTELPHTQRYVPFLCMQAPVCAARGPAVECDHYKIYC